MTRFLAAVLLSGGLVAVATAQPAKKDPAQAKKLRAEIAQLRARLATLEAQLARLEGKPARPPAPRELLTDRMEVGQVGAFQDEGGSRNLWQMRVVQILDKDRMIVANEYVPRHPFVLKGKPTAGLAEEKVITLPGLWQVTGTVRHAARSYYVVEPKAD